MLIRISSIFLIFLTTIAPECFAASFDCEKATSQAEKMICGDKNLSSLDDELDVAYKSALESRSDKKALKESQRKWIKEERDRCNDVQTMADAYTKRIGELKASIPQDTKNLLVNSISDRFQKPEKKTNTDKAEKKYPPYPDVWGIELPVYGTSPRFDFAAKMADGDCFFSYIKERKGQLETGLETYKYAWIKYFAQENKAFEKDEYGNTDKKIRDEKRQIKLDDRYTVVFNDGSSIKYDNRSYHPYYRYLRKIDKNGKETACKMLLYLYDKPVKTSVNTMLERNMDYDKDYYFKKVDNMEIEYLISLEDDTFLFVSHGPESVVVLRFDKDFNTKSDLMGKDIFMIDCQTADNLYSRKGISDAGSDDALYEYLLKIKREK
jgi:uncharacterized protein